MAHGAMGRGLLTNCSCPRPFGWMNLPTVPTELIPPIYKMFLTAIRSLTFTSRTQTAFRLRKIRMFFTLNEWGQTYMLH